MTAAELGQARLPRRPQPDADLEALGDGHAFWRLELAPVAREEGVEDDAKLAATTTIVRHDHWARGREGRTC